MIYIRLSLFFQRYALEWTVWVTRSQYGWLSIQFFDVSHPTKLRFNFCMLFSEYLAMPNATQPHFLLKMLPLHFIENAILDLWKACSMWNCSNLKYFVTCGHCLHEKCVGFGGCTFVIAVLYCSFLFLWTSLYVSLFVNSTALQI